MEAISIDLTTIRRVIERVDMLGIMSEAFVAH